MVSEPLTLTPRSGYRAVNYLVQARNCPLIVEADASRCVIVHKGGKPGRKPRGTVERGGRVIGYAVERSRVAAGTNGQRRTFFTATLPCSASPTSGGLGTRYPTRKAAIHAIVAYADFCEARGYDPARYSRVALTLFFRTYDRGF